jgi:hypothetical protein
MNQREKTWTATELAQAAHISDARIRQLLLSGQLQGFKHGPLWAIPDKEARRYLESRKNREKKSE